MLFLICVVAVSDLPVLVICRTDSVIVLLACLLGR